MKQQAVVSLDQATERKDFGGKASNLAKILQNKVQVPDGLAVGISAFSTDGKLLPKYVKVVEDWLSQQKGNITYAVRSSALGEDGNQQSWAGQFDTFLDVSSTDVVDKIIACHNTVSARAQAYAKAKTDNFKVAVVVQKMVQPDFAGVLFTKNPVTSSNEIVIEYVKGLADQLVSGEVTPESYVWDRDSPYVPPTNMPFPLKVLIDQAMIIEKIYGKPQDIEWAFQNDQLWIVQTRPITT